MRYDHETNEYIERQSSDTVERPIASYIKRHVRLFSFLFIFILSLSILTFISYLHTPPHDFPVRTPIEITEGTTFIDATKILEEKGAVRSSLFLQIIAKIRFGDMLIKAETYYFEEPLDTTEVARAVSTGTHIIPPIRLTIQEGLRIDEIDTLVSENLPEVSSGEFTKAAGQNEGFLFPDTYYIPESFSAEDLVALMSKTFSEKMGTLQRELGKSPYSLSQIVTMASIIEREAKDTESKHLVSGILWKRYEIGMPLQVDAPFEYIYERSADTLTSEDLLIDSPYNTYKNTGLPPTPIVNPGIDSIKAALDPHESPYLYYITGSDGNFYYAETFEEHKQNIANHLK